MSDVLYAYQGDNENTQIAKATLSGGALTWDNPNILGPCKMLKLSQNNGDPGAQFDVWFPIDPGTLTLNSGFPRFNVTTAFGLFPSFSLTYTSQGWLFSGVVYGNQANVPIPQNATAIPDQLLQLQIATFSSNPPDWKIDVPTQSTPVVGIGFRQIDGAWTLYLSITNVQPSGPFWQDFRNNGNFTLAFTYLHGTPGSSPTFPKACMILSGFDNGLMTDYWNLQIAQPYLVSVATAEPDAPLSALFTLPPQTGAWVYLAFVAVQAQDLSSANVTWQPGCFSLNNAASFTMPDLFTHSGAVYQGNLNTLPVIPDRSLTQQFAKTTPSTTPIFAFRIPSIESIGVQAMRLGALDLTLSTAPSRVPDASWHVLGYVEPGKAYFEPGKTLDRPRIVVQDLQILLDQVQVGSEDPLAGDDAANLPIVIPLSGPAPQSSVATPPYTLDLREQNPLGQQRTLTLSIMQNGTAAGGSASLLVLDRDPFFVARVTLPSLLGNGNASNTIPAVWSNTFPYGDGWHTQSGAQPVQVSLPPQGIGEQMERAKDIPEGTVLDYRFAPAAQLELAPPVLAGNTTNYFEAPWNFRRLLASPGQNVPGPLLPSFDAEFFYGLPVTVTSSELRVAEISALTGRLAAALTGTSDAAIEWSQILQAFQTRLSALVPWDGYNPNSLLLSDEAQYSLRSSADLAVPFSPVPSGTVPYPKSPAGLKGGVGWLFDSANVYQQLWQQPGSTSALLADPVFSALGGWAKQRAVFARGIVTINSHVEMGRVSTASVEYLGRIGALWNRAKLVVVYERTVQASDQFADSQFPHQGQPIVRKVMEYVELLEPIRSYPESGSGSINVGFVNGSEFKSKIIYVDSAWGSDVGTSGWQVPLFNPAANPAVYPKPHILLNVAVDPKTGAASQNQEITDPQKLVFYTELNAGPDPDAWESVANVDFADVDTTLGATAYASRSSQSYRLSVNPGWGRFTWNLAPGPYSANVVAQRSGTISAGIKNVSMMRSRPGGKTNSPPPLLPLAQVSDHASSLFQEIADNLSPASGLTTVFTNQKLDSYFSDLTGLAATAASSRLLAGSDSRQPAQGCSDSC